MTGGITLILVLALNGRPHCLSGRQLEAKSAKNGSGFLACALMTLPCS